MSSPDILVAGETLIDLFPVDGNSSVDNEIFQRRAGGAPANVSVAMEKFDTPVLLWTSVGDDGFGEYLKSTLQDASVSSRFIIQRDQASTGIALVDKTVNGGFELYIEGTATINFDIDELPETVFDDLEWVHFGGVLLANEFAQSAMFDLLERASVLSILF